MGKPPILLELSFFNTPDIALMNHLLSFRKMIKPLDNRPGKSVKTESGGTLTLLTFRLLTIEFPRYQDFQIIAAHLPMHSKARKVDL
jgi:hypothetical protein